MVKDRQQLLWLYEKMLLIRQFEDTMHRFKAEGQVPGLVHLYAGEEAVAVGVCAHLRDDDFLTSTHRGHGHCLAKGVDLPGMVAEILGKATGVCKGKGGSMHIADVDKGMLGANGIVGGGLPLACGSALMAKTKKTDQVTVCFFGDGAANQGTFHESLNLAAIWDLPVVFVCENNLYAETTSVDYAMRIKDIAVRAQGYGLPGVVADGMDVFAMYEAAGAAVRRARLGQGPTLLEAKTYRYYGHFEGDTGKYRPPAELAAYQARDCLANFQKRVLGEGLLTVADLDAVERQTRQALAAAIAFAQSSPYPAPAECLQDVYVSY